MDPVVRLRCVEARARSRPCRGEGHDSTWRDRETPNATPDTLTVIPLKTNVCKFLIERPTTLDGRASLAACPRGGSAARSNQYWQSDSGLVGECLARSAQRHAARPTGPRVASSAAYTSLTCFERTVQTPRRRHQYAISYDTRAPAHSARHRPIRTRPERVRDTKPSRSSLPRSAPR